MPIVAKKKEIDSHTEIENTSVNFNTLNYPEKSVNTYVTDDESEWERDFSTYISNYDSSSTDLYPRTIFSVP